LASMTASCITLSKQSRLLCHCWSDRFLRDFLNVVHE
jgi:hypothetical protein